MVRSIARARPCFPEPDIETILALIRRSLCSGHLTNGAHVREFERRFAASIGVRHAIAVSTGTAALEISLRAMGISGKEVILPTETFVASANSIILAGGTPVFAEIHPDTYCLDIEDVEHRITDRTAAVMLVHMAGLVVPNIGQFQELCEQQGIELIEDAAHAHGASHAGKRAGSFGRAGCFSFYPTKVITTAEGGMITTDDDALAWTARSLRNHGANPDGSDYTQVSTNLRMAEPLAAIGLVQLGRLEEFVERRNAIAALYTSGLRGIEGIRPLPVAGDVHSYWNYLAVLEDERISRPGLAQCLQERYGVEIAWPYDPPCHMQPVFRRVLGSKPGDLPRSEALLQRHIALPMHSALTIEDAEYVLESLQAALSDLRNS
ncbi:MAG: DegT/DnrJ/EryC1/StrS family aminotransferase [Acidobacteria bacterium]|nr:DegT/DnrJ/EryC1/StrS family aminotransferase [Acidobacteriota bacterium]